MDYTKPSEFRFIKCFTFASCFLKPHLLLDVYMLTCALNSLICVIMEYIISHTLTINILPFCLVCVL